MKYMNFGIEPCGLALPKDHIAALDHIAHMLRASKSQVLEQHIIHGQAIDYFMRGFGDTLQNGKTEIQIEGLAGPERYDAEIGLELCDSIARSRLNFEILPGDQLQAIYKRFATLQEAYDYGVGQVKASKTTTYTIHSNTFESLTKKYKGGSKLMGYTFAQMGMIAWLYNDGADYGRYLTTPEHRRVMEFLSHQVSEYNPETNRFYYADTRGNAGDIFLDYEPITEKKPVIISTTRGEEMQHSYRPARFGNPRRRKN